MNPTGKLKIGFYLAAIFAAGFVTGVIVTIQVGRHMMPGQADMAARWCRELQSRMNLTPGQVEKIRPILNDAIGELKSQLSADMLLNLSNHDALIAAELTPEQKPKFDQIQKEEQDMIRDLFGGETNGAPKKP
jgi:hypothetical protein